MLTYEDYDRFFYDKAEWHPEVGRVAPSTREKQRQIVFKAMREAGLLSVEGPHSTPIAVSRGRSSGSFKTRLRTCFSSLPLMTKSEIGQPCMLNAEELTPTQRYEHLLKVVRSERFLKMQGLGNEVPFFICPYPPQDAVEMGKTVQQLARRLQQDGIRILQIDLYDLSYRSLQARGIWDRVI